MATQQEVRENYLKWATDAISIRQEDYLRFQDYYNGDHELEFATQKWEDTFGTEFEEFSDNWCQIVVDSMVQRLEILGWEVDGGPDDLASRAEEIWDRNYGTLQSDDVHTQAAIKGDAYLMVWNDPENEGEAQLFYNDAVDTIVHYDPTNPLRIVRAAKSYKDLSGRPHIILYFPERVQFWVVPDDISPDQAAAMMQGGLEHHDALRMGFAQEKPDVLNPFKEVPVFHFKNRGKGQDFGLSELKTVIPVQNAVNKLLMDMMVGSEFGSFRQKYVAANAQPKEGWKVGGDRVWATSDTQAKFGEFGQIDLEPMFKAVEVMVAHIAKITQTPMHYLRTSGDMPSGEALKTAESGLVQKVEDRQKHWGSVWGRALKFALRIEGVEVPREAVIYPKWKAAPTRHELEQAQTAQLKSILGIPLEHLWSEHFGYSEEQIAEFKDLNQAVAAAVLARVISQISQLPPGTEQVTATPDQLVELLRNAPQNGNEGEGEGLDVSQILALLPKNVTGGTTAGEATTKPQANTRPPASPTRRSTGFKD